MTSRINTILLLSLFTFSNLYFQLFFFFSQVKTPCWLNWGRLILNGNDIWWMCLLSKIHEMLKNTFKNLKFLSNWIQKFSRSCMKTPRKIKSSGSIFSLQTFIKNMHLLSIIVICLDIKYNLCACAKLLNHVRFFATPWTVGCQTPLFVGFSRHKYWSGLPFPPLGDLPYLEKEPISLMCPVLPGGFFTTSTTWEYNITYPVFKR